MIYDKPREQHYDQCDNACQNRRENLLIHSFADFLLRFIMGQWLAIDKGHDFLVGLDIVIFFESFDDECCSQSYENYEQPDDDADVACEDDQWISTDH